ncbi:MAG: PH domain-containing protein [Vicinamibacterales bacterium]
MTSEPDRGPRADSLDAGATVDGAEHPSTRVAAAPGLPRTEPDAASTAQGAGLAPCATAEPASDREPIADGEERHLDPRSVVLGRLRGGITCLSLSLPLLIVAVFSALASGSATGGLFWLGGWAALTALLAWRAVRWPEVAHRHKSYRLDADGIEIKHGVFWRTVVNVPRSRVQHTDVAQGPLERRFGLGRLVIYTAGSAYARVALEGLEHTTALRIRDYLLPGGGSDAL